MEQYFSIQFTTFKYIKFIRYKSKDYCEKPGDNVAESIRKSTQNITKPI